MNFTIIGDDKRMNYATERLYSYGCEVSNSLDGERNDICLLLPPPVNLNIYDVIKPFLNNIKIIYGGSISNDFISKINNSIQVYDYLSWEHVIRENARLTALGIIKEASSYNAELINSHVLVTGYGFCGKALAVELKKLGARVTIALRNQKYKNEIIKDGYEYMDINSMEINNLYKFNYLFNTVPALIIHKNVIDVLSSSIMIFDIASKPGGVDFDYCKEKGIFSILSLGIPGRYFPKEAGQLIGNSCYAHYNSLI